MASLIANGKQYYTDNAGLPLVGGKLFTFVAGASNVPKATFADSAGLIPNTNPVILDSRGEALIFWGGSYKVQLQDVLGNVIWTVDNVTETNLGYRTSSNGSAITPSGTTVQRDAAPLPGYFRYNVDLNCYEGYYASWTSFIKSINGSAVPDGGNVLLKSVNGVSLLGAGDIAAGIGGATTVTSAIDITLTNASPKTQLVTMTASGKSVFLPDATTLTKGDFPFDVANAKTGTNTFTIRDFGGNGITTATAGQKIFLTLIDNSTAAGVWIATLGGGITELIVGTATVGNAVVSSYISVTKLTSTTALITYYDNVRMSSVVVTITGATISFGTILTNISVNSAAYVSTSMLSPTQVICAFRDTTTTFLVTIILNISGTTVTAGSPLTVNAEATTYISVATLSPTQAICHYVGSGNAKAVTLNISVSTITNGAVAAITAGSSISYCTITVLTSIKAIAAYSDATAGNTRAVVLDISGTTVTPATIAVVYGGGTSTYLSIAALSSTKAILAYSGASSFLNAVILDVVTSTITAGTALTVNGVDSRANTIAVFNATTVVCVYRNTNDALNYMVQLSIATSTITNGALTSLPQTGSIYNGIAALSANKAVLAFPNVSNFLTAETIEYTVSV